VWRLGLLFLLQGAGMASVVPSATESVMSSLPRERAGVGSAVNNTIRQVGGALGVAVLGSVLSSVYRERIYPQAVGLPEALRETATESLAGTHGVAERLGSTGVALLGPANQAFVEAMRWAAGGAAVVILIGVLVALRWLPTRVAVPLPVTPWRDPELVEAG
jgi:DHA2 family multidrug resistance protein-like MFS transporter